MRNANNIHILLWNDSHSKNVHEPTPRPLSLNLSLLVRAYDEHQIRYDVSCEKLLIATGRLVGCCRPNVIYQAARGLHACFASASTAQKKRKRKKRRYVRILCLRCEAEIQYNKVSSCQSGSIDETG